MTTVDRRKEEMFTHGECVYAYTFVYYVFFLYISDHARGACWL